MGQGSESQRGQHELCDGGTWRQPDKHTVLPERAPQRDCCLKYRDGEGEDKCEMTEFDNHGFAPLPGSLPFASSRQTPCFLSVSATSRGM